MTCEVDALIGRWCDEPWASVRQRIVERGSIEDAPLPRGPLREVADWDLRGIVLDSCRLVGLDLHELDHASFRDASLARCRMTSASLTRTDLSGAEIVESWPMDCAGTETVLEGVRARDTDFSCAQLTLARMAGAAFVGGRWSSSRLMRCDLRRTRFINCDLNSAKFTGSTLDGAVFEDCDLGYTDLRGVSLRGARLLRCDMEGAEWAGADLTDADVKTSMVRF